MLSLPASFTFLSDEVSQDPLVVARFARAHGFAGIELRSMFGKPFRELTGRDVATLRGILVDHGLVVHGCASPVFKSARGDAAAHGEHRDLFRRSVDLAGALDCRLIRVFTFLRESTPAVDDGIRAAADAVAGLRPFAGPIRIGVENEASCIVGTANEAARFLALLPADAAGLIWDPCNVLYVPGHGGAATAGFAALAPRIIHIHAKDAVRELGGAAPCRMGNGEVGWERHFREIAASGYRGLVSLETHWRPAALDAAELHLPGGHAFSAGGEAATNACLDSIRSLLNQGAT